MVAKAMVVKSTYRIYLYKRPRGDAFSKGGGGGGRLLPIKKSTLESSGNGR